MRILLFTGGAGDMYCGSCLRDNALAGELLRRGHDVVLTPLYTPTRTDERNVSGEQVFFGGISVYLEQHSALFRHTPKFLDRIWDSPWALKLATRRQIKVDPKSLGEMTVSMLRGESGYQAKEISKLLDWLRTEPPFDVINLPYSLLISLAEPLKRALKVPICCTLQGDDLFLDQLGEPHRSQSLSLIRSLSRHVDLFVAVSAYYYDYMPAYLGIPREKMRLARLGITTADFAPRTSRPAGPFTVGYFARVAPEKGFHVLAEAYRRFRQRQGSEGSRLLAAGYLPPEHHDYLRDARSLLASAGLAQEFDYRGELDRSAKAAFFHEMDVLSVPATYREPKGLFLLEAMASGVPVVQPRVGAFPEIIERTGGGVIVEADDPDALADALLALKQDEPRAEALGRTGAAGVREHYSVERMAEQVEAVYRELARPVPA
ncbi:MAG TPA: glycosyltransferase family 4 protein [Vicinamibacterales bacterium]|nr:glycosyltransferase family 4 protein [Vicinamibacterales bacterium]